MRLSHCVSLLPQLFGFLSHLARACIVLYANFPPCNLASFSFLLFSAVDDHALMYTWAQAQDIAQRMVGSLKLKINLRWLPNYYLVRSYLIATVKMTKTLILLNCQSFLLDLQTAKK